MLSRESLSAAQAKKIPAHAHGEDFAGSYNAGFFRDGPRGYLRASALAAALASSDMWQGRQLVKWGKSAGRASAIFVWQP